MSLTSFLTQDPVNYASSTNQQSTSLPSWYNDYTQGILQNAAQFANQGYQTYGGPRIADTTSDQQASYNTINQATGLGQGIAQQGVGAVNNALQQPNASAAGAPYLSAASGNVNSALAQPGALQSGQSYLNAASGNVNSALSQPGALSAAQPYLNNAGTPLSQQTQQFMNPYINDVVNTSNQLSARNFNENVLPGLQDQFTRAGQVYGGSQQGVYAARLGAQENLNEQATDAQLLSQGYNSALQGATNQANINAGLGATAGQLANSQQNTGLSAANINAGLGSTAGQLANAQQNTGLSAANINAGLGSTAGNLANASQNTGINAGSALGSLGTTAQSNALQQASAQNAAGQQQQQQTQNNYNLAYQDFLNQQNYPLTAASAMQGALSGIQVPGSTTNYSYSPYGTGQSPLTTAGQIYSGVNSLFGTGGTLTPSARGGSIRRPTLRLSRGGLVRRRDYERRVEITRLAARYG